MAGHRFNDSDPVEEILRIAMQNQVGADLSLRQRLLASAAELGISEHAALEAEQQWQEQKKQEAEFREYRAHTRQVLVTHFGVYAVANFMLAMINMLTNHGHLDWVYYVILSWGIGVGIHLIVALSQLKRPAGEEFDAWRKARSEGKTSSSSGVTIGIHVASPKPIAAPNLDRTDTVDRNQTQA